MDIPQFFYSCLKQASIKIPKKDTIRTSHRNNGGGILRAAWKDSKYFEYYLSNKSHKDALFGAKIQFK